MPLLNPGNPWRPNYVLPQNVLDETPGRGVLVTDWAPRGTISTMQPGLGAYGSHGPLTGLGVAPSGIFSQNTLAGAGNDEGCFGTCEYGSLGGEPKVSVGKNGKDPIVEFGRQSAALFMSKMKNVPAQHRNSTMKAVLDSFDPTLYDSIGKRATSLTQTHAANVALEKAIGSAMSERFARQLIKHGQAGTRPTSGILGLAGYEYRQEALGNFFSDVGKFFSNAGKDIVNAGKSVINGIGSLACKAASSPLLNSAATTAGIAIGGPAGAAAAAKGANIANDICGKSAPPPPPADSGGFPLVPVLIGAGVLAVILLRR